MKAVDTGHIIIEPDVMGGESHIAGYRIAVSDVAIWVNDHHLSPHEIAERFHLSLGEVHAALAYFYDHRDAIDRGIAETDRQAAAMARAISARLASCIWQSVDRHPLFAGVKHHRHASNFISAERQRMTSRTFTAVLQKEDEW